MEMSSAHRTSRFASLVAALFMSASLCLAEDVNLAQNGDFEAPGDGVPGWNVWPGAGIRATVEPGIGREGTRGCLVVSQLPEVACGGLGQHANVMPPGSRIRLRIWVKTEGFDPSGGAALCVNVFDADGNQIAFCSTERDHKLCVATDWTEPSAILSTPEAAATANVCVFCNGTGKAWFDDVEVVREGPAEPEDIARSEEHMLFGAGLVTAQGAWRFEAREPAAAFSISLPIPMCFGQQVPLGYRLTVDPPEKLLSYSLRERLPEDWIAQVKLADMGAGDKVTVSWESLVLMGRRPDLKLPDAVPFPDPAAIPAEAKPWLAATRCAQADDPRVLEPAQKLRAEAPDLLGFAAKAFPAPWKKPDASLPSQHDAVSALQAWPSEVGAGNALAAQFRSVGVPARVFAGVLLANFDCPTPSVSVQIWMADQGWVTLGAGGEAPPYHTYQVHMSLVYPEDEDGSYRDQRPEPCATWSQPGMPWMTFLEGDPRPTVTAVGLFGEGASPSPHRARILTRFKRDDQGVDVALEDARASWQAYRQVLAQGHSLPAVEDCIRRMQDAMTAGELDIQLEKAMAALPKD